MSYPHLILGISLILLAGCDPKGVADPGTTINSGKSQCRYRIDSASHSCTLFMGTEICYELCNPASPSPTASCGAGGHWSIDMSPALGNPPGTNECDVGLRLLDCTTCDTSIPDLRKK